MKDRRNRREFMSLTGAGIAGVAGAPWLSASAEAAATAGAEDADLVLVNAKVYTVDARAPRAEAFAVKAGRFVAVGSSATSGRSPARVLRPSTPSR